MDTHMHMNEDTVMRGSMGMEINHDITRLRDMDMR